MSDTVVVNGVHYRPVDEDRAKELEARLADFTSEGSTFWRNFFIERDTSRTTGVRFGMYAEGDENAPFFSEAFLYNLLGKDEARSVLSIIRQLAELAGVKFEN